MAPLKAFAARGAVWLTGAGALGFLHRLTTANVAALGHGEGAPTLLLTDTGRVIDALDVYAGPDGVLVLTTTVPGAASVTGHLRSLVLYGDEVRVTDASAQVAVLTLCQDAPGLNERVRAALGLEAEAASAEGSTAASSAADWARYGWRAEEAWLLRSFAMHEPTRDKGGTAEAAGAAKAAGTAEAAGTAKANLPEILELVVPLALAAEAATLLGVELASAIDHDCWRVEHARPAFGAELGVPDAGNPHELGMMGQVDDTKGCYVGQEVVARLGTYDRVRRALVRVQGSGLATGMRLAPKVRGRPGLVTTAPGRCDDRHGSPDRGGGDAGAASAALGLAPLPVDVGDELRVLDNAGAEVGTAVVRWRAGAN